MTASVSRLLRRPPVSRSARTYSPFASVLLTLPLVALLVSVFVYPIGRLLATSLWDPGFTLTHYAKLLTEPLYFTILARTLRIALLVTVCAFVLGYPLAYLMARASGRAVILLAACVLVPLWTSVLVRSYAWTVLLQRHGLVNTMLQRLGLIDQPLQLLYTEGAVLLAMTHVLLPFMVLPIYSTLRRIPVDLTRAAKSLGANGPATLRHVVLPLSLPGVAAGSVIVFILGIGFFITPALVGGPRTLMISTLIGQQATELLNWPFAGALSGVLLIVTLVLVLVFKRALRLNRVVEDAA